MAHTHTHSAHFTQFLSKYSDTKATYDTMGLYKCFIIIIIFLFYLFFIIIMKINRTGCTK